LSIVRDLYSRFRQLIHEGFKFLVVGAIGTIVTFGVANLLRHIGDYKAVTVATIVATIVTYLGNRYWSFNKRQGQGTLRESIIFLILNGVGLLIYYGCIGLTDLAGLHSRAWYNVALVVGTGLGTLFRFWSYRKWVWTAPGGADSPGWADGAAEGSTPDPHGAQLPADPPAAEALPSDARAGGQPWGGPKHRAAAGRR
jgi:putative flippase GtrA